MQEGSNEARRRRSTLAHTVPATGSQTDRGEPCLRTFVRSSRNVCLLDAGVVDVISTIFLVAMVAIAAVAGYVATQDLDQVRPGVAVDWNERHVVDGTGRGIASQVLIDGVRGAETAAVWLHVDGHGTAGPFDVAPGDLLTYPCHDEPTTISLSTAHRAHGTLNLGPCPTPPTTADGRDTGAQGATDNQDDGTASVDPQVCRLKVGPVYVDDPGHDLLCLELQLNDEVIA